MGDLNSAAELPWYNVAQWWPRTLKVVGSNPTQGSNFSMKKNCLGIWFVLLCFVFLKYCGLYSYNAYIYV